MRKTIGVLAHVDAGKTTFSERLLYHTGSIRSLGRVDYKTSYMDTDEIEQNRGITIFADQAVFNFKGDAYYLIDTPGHIDFSAEAERSIQALDYAILLVSGSSGVEAHTRTLFRLLSSYQIPVFIFINKADMDSFNLETVLNDIKNKLTGDILYLGSINDILEMDKKVVEFAAERDEKFLEAYLEGDYTADALKSTLVSLIKKQECFPVMSGSALKGTGIDAFLELFAYLSPTNYEELKELPFSGRVYKIRHDDNGNRLTFIKALSGKLQVKDEFTFEVEEETFSEKVNEIRVYNGKRYEVRSEVAAGDLFAVTGLKTPGCGMDLAAGKLSRVSKSIYYLAPALQSRVKILDETDTNTCLEKLRLLEAEDPVLSIAFQEETGDILVSVMGKIQLEVLEQIISSRFGISIAFEKPQVQYRETLEEPVVGYGHFEPLRHYAEVQLRLEPNSRGTGITFASECHVDNLAANFQHLVESHVFEKNHKGILTGSPITDINIVLLDGRAHEKHTKGGDFREATFRAIRQGLEKAKSILLEPFYRFEITVQQSYLGRVMSDIQRMRGAYEPPVQIDEENVCIRGRGPVETFMDYSSQLASFTKGTGSISLLFDGYDICENAEEVIERIGYDKDKDRENPSSSIFCSKGTSFVVPWYEAEKYMHTIK